MSSRPASAPVYDHLMQTNLASVFNERDAGKRIGAIGELYAEDAVLYEPPGTAAEGYAAIPEAVARLFASLTPDFAFTATGPALGRHGIGRLRSAARRSPTSGMGGSILSTFFSNPPPEHRSATLKGVSHAQ